MIEPDWPQICGIHVEKDGTIGAVWIAHERQADRIHLYDCAIFTREVPVIIGQSLSNHGRWIPIAWEKKQKAMCEKLKDRGCNMTHEPHDDDDAVAEAVSRDIWERMRGQRFKVERRCAEWLDEFKNFTQKDQKVPREGYPLMSATRYAVAMFDEWARPERMPGAHRKNYPAVAVV